MLHIESTSCLPVLSLIGQSLVSANHRFGFVHHAVVNFPIFVDQSSREPDDQRPEFLADPLEIVDGDINAAQLDGAGIGCPTVGAERCSRGDCIYAPNIVLIAVANFYRKLQRSTYSPRELNRICQWPSL